MSVLYIQKADAPPKAGCNIDIGWLQRGDVDILPIFEHLENNILPDDELQVAMEKSIRDDWRCILLLKAHYSWLLKNSAPGTLMA